MQCRVDSSGLQLGMMIDDRPDSESLSFTSVPHHGDQRKRPEDRLAFNDTANRKCGTGENWQIARTLFTDRVPSLLFGQFSSTLDTHFLTGYRLDNRCGPLEERLRSRRSRPGFSSAWAVAPRAGRFRSRSCAGIGCWADSSRPAARSCAKFANASVCIAWSTRGVVRFDDSTIKRGLNRAVAARSLCRGMDAQRPLEHI
jgi:hypothetical protein